MLSRRCEERRTNSFLHISHFFLSTAIPPLSPPLTLPFPSSFLLWCPDTHTHAHTSQRRVCSVLPVCELERHSDDTREIFNNKLWLQLLVIFFPTADANLRPTFAFLISSEGRFISTESYNASTLLLNFCWWVLFNGRASAGAWGHVSVNASCYDSYLPFPLSTSSPLWFSLFCSKPPSKPTTNYCQAPATLSPTPADTRQMQTLQAGPCTKMVLATQHRQSSNI